MIIIWCPSCKDNKFQLKQRPPLASSVVFENRLVKIGNQTLDNYKTCKQCGTNLERK